MNEKLLEEMFAEATNGNGLPGYVDSIHITEIERFAEIIVRRCATYVKDVTDYCGGHGEPRCPDGRKLASMLKDNFGIKD